jgi:hypothetical protein
VKGRGFAMSRAFVQEDEGRLALLDEEKALKERMERLALLEKRKYYLETDPKALQIDQSKRSAFLARIDKDIEYLKQLLS